MKKIKFASMLFLALVISFVQIEVSAHGAHAKKEFVNVRGKHKKVAAPITDVDGSTQVTVSGTKGYSTATVDLLFHDIMSNSLDAKQDYDVVGEADESKSGKVQILFLQSKKSKGAATNNATIAKRGEVKILKKNEDGTFLISVKAVLKNYTKTSTSGNTDSAGTVTVKGYFTTLPLP